MNSAYTREDGAHKIVPKEAGRAKTRCNWFVSLCQLGDRPMVGYLALGSTSSAPSGLQVKHARRSRSHQKIGGNYWLRTSKHWSVTRR
jgi:hypothetical protein